MKIYILVLCLTLLFIAILPAETDENLIPRRILFESSTGFDSSLAATILLGELSSQTALVIAGNGDIPHNVISINTTDELLTLSLKDRKSLVAEESFPKSIIDNPKDMVIAFNLLTEEWKQYLGLVKPEVVEDLEIKKMEVEETISFEEKLNKPFQLTLWAPVALRGSIPMEGDNDTLKFIWQWPLRVDFSWFFNDNFGIISSFKFEYGNHISYGADLSRNALNTTSLILKPGIGCQFRTLGKLSMEFSIISSLAAVKITANEPLTYPSLNTGESTWVFYPIISLEPYILWSPSADWSVKAMVLGIDFSLTELTGLDSFGIAENSLIVTFLQIGGSYRW